MHENLTLLHQSNRVKIWRLAPNIIQYELIGPIDFQLLLEATDIDQAYLREARLSEAPWSTIVILRDSCEFIGSTGDLAPQFLRQRQHLNFGQISTCCVVESGMDGADVFDTKMFSFYSLTNVAYQSFHDIVDALEWTHRQLFAANEAL